MSFPRRRSALGLLVLSLTSSAPAARAEDAPSEALPARPVHDSIEPVVARIEREGNEPCLKAAEAGVPCYPTSIEAHGPVYSVRDSLGVGREKNSSGVPLPSGFGPAGVRVLFDPVCIAKSAIKALKGKNDVYYLYRTRLPSGSYVQLREEPVDPATFQGNVEFLGRFEGECDALAAYRWEEHRLIPVAHKTDAAGPPAR